MKTPLRWTRSATSHLRVPSPLLPLAKCVRSIPFGSRQPNAFPIENEADNCQRSKTASNSGGVQIGVLLAITFVVMTAPAAGARSFAIGASAVRIDGDAVVVNEEAFSRDALTFTIEGTSYRADHIDRESSLEGEILHSEVLRFTLPGALTSSTVTRIGGLTAVTLVTRDAFYRLQSSASDASMFALDSADAKVRTKASDLDNDTMTPFEVAVRTGNFKVLDIQALAVAPTSRRRSVNPSPTIEHRNIAIYTARFAAHYGGNVDAIHLAIQHAFDVRDTVLRDSGVFGIRDTLVYMEERNDPTLLAINQVADALATFVTDSYVQSLRIKYQANAGYWDHNPNASTSGMAIIFEGQPSVTCGTYYITWQRGTDLERLVVHELGHVGGGEHNKTSATQYACPYCYGWYNDYARDVMAATCGEMDCNQIMLYSTPNIVYKADFWDYHGDVIVGSAEQNVARRLSETRTDVRDFWKTIPSP